MEREEAARALELLTRVVNQARDDYALQNWGRIWMLHGITNGIAFVATDILLHRGVRSVLSFAILWALVLAVDIGSIWPLKQERSGVSSFLEKQIWSIWSTYVGAMVLAAFVNWLMGLDVLFMGPVAAILAAVSFSIMGALMGRVWYAASLAFVIVALVSAAMPVWK